MTCRVCGRALDDMGTCVCATERRVQPPDPGLIGAMAQDRRRGFDDPSHLAHGPAQSGAGGLVGDSETRREEPEGLERPQGRAGEAKSAPRVGQDWQNLEPRQVSTPAIIHDAERQWKMERREVVTASEAAAIIGADERRGAFAVWADKTGEVEMVETLPMRRGRRLEALILEEYGEQTGRAVTPWPRFKLLRHPTIAFIAATLDATTIAEGIEIPLEAKSALGSAAEWGEEPPLAYQIQSQLQGQCFGSRVMAIAGLIGPGPLKTFDLPRDDAFFAALVPQLERFRWHVERRIPPEADGKPGTSAAVRRLWAGEDGETVPLDAEAERLVSEWEAAKERTGAAKDTADELENKLRVRLAGASFGALPDGSFLTLRLTKRAGYSVGATSFRTLRRMRPRLKRG